ncbi:MAG: hypothetical protein DRO39_05955 [Thermoprotei archaeon]|nr:MAG: hypothetical protein DRO39_05955 [Thermoprotei archaeon]
MKSGMDVGIKIKNPDAEREKLDKEFRKILDIYVKTNNELYVLWYYDTLGITIGDYAITIITDDVNYYAEMFAEKLGEVLTPAIIEKLKELGVKGDLSKIRVEGFDEENDLVIACNGDWVADIRCIPYGWGRIYPPRGVVIPPFTEAVAKGVESIIRSMYDEPDYWDEKGLEVPDEVFGKYLDLTGEV